MNDSYKHAFMSPNNWHENHSVLLICQTVNVILAKR